MHIVLLILKVIGVILLILLGLLIALTAAVLFVPLRYKLEAEKEGKGPDRLFCHASITWLLRLLALHVHKDEQLTSVFLKVGPFRVKTFYENRKPVRTDSEVSEEKEREEEDAFSEAMQEAIVEALAPDVSSDDTEAAEEAGAVLLADEQRLEKHAAEIAEKAPEKTAAEPAVKSGKQSGNVRPVSKSERAEEAEHTTGRQNAGKIPHIDGSGFVSFFVKMKQTLLRLQLFLVGLPDLIFDVLFRLGDELDKLEKTVETLCDRVESIREKIASFTDAGSMAAYRHILREVKAFAHHCRVRKLDGNVVLGTGSADTTGEAVGVIYTILPAASSLVLEPDFYEKVLEGKIITAGRVRLIHSAVAAVKLLLDKNVRRLLGKLRAARGGK